MSLEIKDMVSSLNDKGFYEISKDADILNSKVLDLVSSFKKIKSESEIPELTHQFNILKNQLKGYKQNSIRVKYEICKIYFKTTKRRCFIWSNRKT